MAQATTTVVVPEPIVPPATITLNIEMTEAEAAEFLYLLGYRVTAHVDTPLGAVIHAAYASLHDQGVVMIPSDRDATFVGTVRRVGR